MNLQNLNVTELSAQEVQETDGGWLITAIAIAGAGIAIWDAVDGFVEGMEEAYEE